MKKLFSFLLSLLLVMSLAAPAFATSTAGTLLIEGEEDHEITVTPGSGYHADDLFGAKFKNIMPGDRIRTKVFIKANFLKFSEDSIKVTIVGIPHDETENPLKYSETFEATDGKDQTKIDGQRDETIATMTDFLSKLDLKVTSPSKTAPLLDGTADKLLKETSFTFRNKGQVQLDLELYWDPTEDYDYNQYAKRVGEIDWQITISAYDDPDVDNPKTGDYIMMAVAVMAVRGVALAVLLIRKKRKK